MSKELHPLKHAICHKCKRTKPLVNFKSEKGHSLWCSKCRLNKIRYNKKSSIGKPISKRQQLKLDRRKLNPDIESICTKCKHVKLLSSFVSERKTHTLMCDECRLRTIKDKKNSFEEKPQEERGKRKKRYLKYKSNPDNVLKARKQSKEWYAKHVGSDKVAFCHLKSDATFRGISVQISFDDFKLLRKMPCTYCGTKTIVGIDRQNNSMDYSKTNSVPCCRTCNSFKLYWDCDGFLILAAHISAFNGKDGHLSSHLLPITKGSYKFYQFKSQAKTRNIDIKITEREYDIIRKQSCYMCGREGPGGIDRRNSSDVYVHGNIYPCCNVCNVSKWEMNHEEFILHCEKIYIFNKAYLIENRIFERSYRVFKNKYIKG